MNKIQIKNITKKYNNLTALDDVSFSFEFGKIYGLLGRNGAGKSTLINIIANRIFADEGMILVDDIPAKENMQVHEKVFCMSEADLYDSVMSKPNQHLCSHIFFLASLLDVCPKTRRSDNCTYNRRYHLKPWLHIGTLPYLSCFIDYNHLFIDNLNRFFK